MSLDQFLKGEKQAKPSQKIKPKSEPTPMFQTGQEIQWDFGRSVHIPFDRLVVFLGGQFCESMLQRLVVDKTAERGVNFAVNFMGSRMGLVKSRRGTEFQIGFFKKDARHILDWDPTKAYNGAYDYQINSYQANVELVMSKFRELLKKMGS